MKDLLGGEERIDPESGYWTDAFIVNLGKPGDEELSIAPQDLDNWHVDGDFFVCILFSFCLRSGVLSLILGPLP